LTIPHSKSGKTRHAPLSEGAIAVLGLLKSWVGSAYVFPSPKVSGEPMDGRNFMVRTYLPALAAATIDGVTWHTLRHSFASRLVMRGVDIRTVQELMGHSTILMTMRYAHLSPGHLRETVNKATLGVLSEDFQAGTVTKTVTSETEGSNAEIHETPKRLNSHGKKWRRRAGSNRRIAVLQTAPLATWVRRRCPALIANGPETCQTRTPQIDFGRASTIG